MTSVNELGKKILRMFPKEFSKGDSFPNSDCKHSRWPPIDFHANGSPLSSSKGDYYDPRIIAQYGQHQHQVFISHQLAGAFLSL